MQCYCAVLSAPVKLKFVIFVERDVQATLRINPRIFGLLYEPSKKVQVFRLAQQPLIRARHFSIMLFFHLILILTAVIIVDVVVIVVNVVSISPESETKSDEN